MIAGVTVTPGSGWACNTISDPPRRSRPSTGSREANSAAVPASNASTSTMMKMFPRLRTLWVIGRFGVNR